MIPIIHPPTPYLFSLHCVLIDTDWPQTHTHPCIMWLISHFSSSSSSLDCLKIGWYDWLWEQATQTDYLSICEPRVDGRAPARTDWLTEMDNWPIEQQKASNVCVNNAINIMCVWFVRCGEKYHLSIYLVTHGILLTHSQLLEGNHTHGNS